MKRLMFTKIVQHTVNVLSKEIRIARNNVVLPFPSLDKCPYFNSIFINYATP